MASGNQVNNGNCADLPVAPTNNKRVITTKMVLPDGNKAAWGNTLANSTLPKVLYIKKTANRKPKSPMRFITNAFLAALA